ncbi:MAG: fibronectin type III domain-containing protein [Patescibacteria group bacterium]|nr:fibronectin type III domain-containing protein [Patescibacteria group bacterium]
MMNQSHRDKHRSVTAKGLAIAGAIASVLALASPSLAAFAATKGEDNGRALGHAIAPGWNKNHPSFSIAASNGQPLSADGQKADGDDDSAGSDDGSQTPGPTTPTSALPPVISGISSPTVLQPGQTGTWTVSASDPQNGTLSYSVDWGESPRWMAFLAAQPVFVQTASFSHEYSSPGVYTVTFTVKDSAGLTTTSSVTVNIASSSSGPVISGLSATSTRPSSATIAWKTNERSDSEVWYGTSSPVDTSGAPQIEHVGDVFYHAVRLTGLQSATTYFAVVGSKGPNGAMSTSSEISFVTPTPANAKPPVITSVAGPGSLTAGEQGTWSVDAYDPQDQPLSYSVDWGDQPAMRFMALVARQPVYLQTSTFSHEYAATGTYTVTFTAKDASGLTTSSSTAIEVTAASSTASVPVISGLNASAIGTSTAAIGWSTDQSSDSTAYYSTSSPVIGGAGTLSASDPSSITNHSIVLTGLSPSTLYYVAVRSSDAAGAATSSEISFSTAAAATTTASTSPTISNAMALVGTGSVKLTWDTADDADSEVYYSTSSPVVIGASSTQAVVDPSLAASHEVTVSGLSAGTSYRFIIKSVDANGNSQETGEFGLTTAPVI